MKTTESILSAIIVVLAVLFAIEKCKSNKVTIKDNTNIISALNDTLRIYRDKYNNQVGTIITLQTRKAEDFLLLKIKDEEIQQLQTLVSDYKKKLKPGSSATNASIETSGNFKNTTTITRTDTVRKDSLVYIYPTYTARSDTANKWISYNITANRDSVSLDSLKIKNDFSIVVGVDKKKPFVDLILKNPYSDVKQLRTYQVSLPKPKKWGIGISAGGTVNRDLKPTPYLGIGLNYNLIRF